MAATWLFHLLRGHVMTGAGFTALGTGSYILYTDATRYNKLHRAFCTGRILPPLSTTSHHGAFFPRPADERRILTVLEPRFNEQYHVIYGEAGTGKTQLVLRCVRNLMMTSGTQGRGAPVYVMASQGKSFADTLAKAVGFSFDEHISFTFFVKYLIGIHALPGKNEHHKLQRVLNAIEEASFSYRNTYGQPAVLVIDDTKHLAIHVPGALEKIQEKAKLWADTNIVKVVFITNDDETEMILQSDQSSWSRADNPLYVGDLTQEQAVNFLTTTSHHQPAISTLKSHPQPTITTNNNNDDDDHGDSTASSSHLTHQVASRVVDILGGRVQHLLQIRCDLREGVTEAEAVRRLKGKEREKLLNAQKSQAVISALEKLMAKPHGRMGIDRFARLITKEEFSQLIRQNIVSIHRLDDKLVIKFYSQLTETVIKEWLDSRKSFLWRHIWPL